MSTHRIKFAKRGSLIFVSHLDFAHSFTRALKRASIPIKYSEGFSPHPKQVFALPLSVGMVGENELCDITLTEELSNEQVFDMLSTAFTSDIEIKEVYTPDIKMGRVKSAKYLLVFDALSHTDDEINAVLSSLPAVMKTTKSGKEKELDIMSMVYEATSSTKDGKTTLHLTLASSGESYLSPDLVLTSMKSAGLDIPDEYDITRTDIFFESK